MKVIIKYKYFITGFLLGGVAGYLYYKFIGCGSGNCAITSNPFISSLYGAIIGTLLVSSLKNK